MSTIDINRELAKTSLAKELLSLMFPDTYSEEWDVCVTKDGILYCSGDHDKIDECSFERIEIRENTAERYRHKKRGTHYTKKAVGILQVEPGTVLKDGDKLVAYTGEEDGGMWWFRSPEEFYDGRFEYVKDSKRAESPALPKGSNLQRLISELRKQTKDDKESADHNGSFQGSVNSGVQLNLLDRIEQAASLDYLVRYDTKTSSPKDLRRLKINAMWAAHRHWLNPFAIVEGDIPKERKDLIAYYGMYLDAVETIDGFYTFDKDLVQKEYPDEVFDRMMGQIAYCFKRFDNLDLGEDKETLTENCVANILRIASNFSDKEPTSPSPETEDILERLREVHRRNPSEYSEICQIIDSIRRVCHG